VSARFCQYPPDLLTGAHAELNEKTLIFSWGSYIDSTREPAALRRETSCGFITGRLFFPISLFEVMT